MKIYVEHCSSAEYCLNEHTTEFKFCVKHPFAPAGVHFLKYSEFIYEK